MEEIERIVKSLNRKGALKVLSLLTKKGEMKFNDIARAVGHSSGAGRILKDFKRLGIVKKRELKNPLGVVMYGLTKKGLRLLTILEQLKSLEDKN